MSENQAPEGVYSINDFDIMYIPQTAQLRIEPKIPDEFNPDWEVLFSEEEAFIEGLNNYIAAHTGLQNAWIHTIGKLDTVLLLIAPVVSLFLPNSLRNKLRWGNLALFAVFAIFVQKHKALLSAQDLP